MKGLRVTKIVKEVKFEGALRELNKKKIPETIIYKTYETLVYMWNSALRESLISAFQEFFTSTNKIFILVGRLGTMLSFFEVFRLS